MKPAKIKILFATKNHGKLIEFRETFNKLHGDDNYKVISFNDLNYGIPDCNETGTTFEENAILKVKNARNYLQHADKNLIIVGDDSGMQIDYLDDKPGVFTRRWNGKEMSDQEIIDYCLNQMQGAKNRSASYISCFAASMPNGTYKTIFGENRGTILERPEQTSMLDGMPFRSLFFVPELNLMFHEVRELPVTQRKGYILGHEKAIKEIIDYLNKNIAPYSAPI